MATFTIDLLSGRVLLLNKDFSTGGGISDATFNNYTNATSSILSGLRSDVDISIGLTTQLISDVDQVELDLSNLESTVSNNSIAISGNTSAISNKLNTSVFNSYTGDTSTILGGLRTDVDENRTIINTLTGSTGDLPVATFNSYTGATSTVLSELRTDVNIISGTTNNNLTNWTFLVTNFDTSPTINGTITQGVVYNYIYDNITRYRFVPTIYDPKEDSFYSGFNGTTLTGKIISRGI